MNVGDLVLHRATGRRFVVVRTMEGVVYSCRGVEGYVEDCVTLKVTAPVHRLELVRCMERKKETQSALS